MFVSCFWIFFSSFGSFKSAFYYVLQERSHINKYLTNKQCHDMIKTLPEWMKYLGQVTQVSCFRKKLILFVMSSLIPVLIYSKQSWIMSLKEVSYTKK